MSGILNWVKNSFFAGHIGDAVERASERHTVGKAGEEHEERDPSPAPIPPGPAVQHGHRFDKANISDHARAQFGDTTINNYYNSHPQTHTDEYKLLLASLTFDRMDARLQNVVMALPATCEWLIQHEQFIAWSDIESREHSSFLWIKGKPGSGKSTIMKHTLAWAEKMWSSQIILSYFFNARAPDQLEKSSLGLYRSLLHQLLSALPSSHAFFEKRFASKIKDKTVEAWSEKELQNFLIELITALPLSLLNIFIDALDEGSDNDVRDMVMFLEDLTQHAIAAHRPLRICLSSRHYPHIIIDKSLSLIVEDEVGHKQDIELYIRNRLPGDKNPQIDHLRSEILNRSAGVFLWVVLIVAMLKRDYDRGKTWDAMLRKLQEVPPGLDNVFAELFPKDPEDLKECITLLEWILFSKQPLSLIELYCAVQYTCLDMDTDTDTEDDTALTSNARTRWLLDCSRGLVELTKVKPFTVQVIHETVRDYLLDSNRLRQRQSMAYGLDPLALEFRADSCHMKIAEECLLYLLLVCKRVPLTKEILKQHPLARYAAQFWWQHLQSSQSSCSQRLLDSALRLLDNRANLLIWVQLYDIDSRSNSNSPNLSIAAENLAPPLYYAALIGSPELVLHILSKGADVNAQGGDYGNALQAASGTDVNAQGGRYGNALLAASAIGHERVVQILLENSADPHSSWNRWTPLSQAVERGNATIVKLLIDKEVKFDFIYNLRGVGHRGVFRRTPLSRAAEKGDEAVVKLLLENGARPDFEDEDGQSPLSRAVESGSTAVVRLLNEPRWR